MDPTTRSVNNLHRLGRLRRKQIRSLGKINANTATLVLGGGVTVTFTAVLNEHRLPALSVEVRG